MQATGADGITRFERAIIFRVARGFFFVIAVMAVFVFIAGLVFGARSLAPPEVQPEKIVEKPAASPALSYQSVARFRKAQLDAENDVAGAVGGQAATSAADKPAEKDVMQEQIKALATKLKALFPDPPYAWDNVIERYCAEQSSFGCLRQDVRVKKKGVVGLINTALDKVPAEQLVHVLEVLVAVLTAAPVEERGDLIASTVELERARIREAEEADRKYAADVAAQKAQHEKAVADAEATRLAWRFGALWAVGAGFAGLIVISLFLAFLAMERHLRALEALSQRSARS